MYVKLVEDLVSKETSSASVDTASSVGQTSAHIETKIVDNIHVIKINRPEKKNALTMEVEFARMQHPKLCVHCHAHAFTHTHCHVYTHTHARIHTHEFMKLAKHAIGVTLKNTCLYVNPDHFNTTGRYIGPAHCDA